MKQPKQKKKIISENYLDRIPVHDSSHPFREKDDGMIEIDMPHTGFYAKVATRFFHKPAVSHIALDAYGSTVWKNIDGANTIYDIVNAMKEAFPKEDEQMLSRVVTFLATLESNHFIQIKPTER